MISLLPLTACAGQSHPESYAGAFTDFDLYLLAIGSDLAYYHRVTGKPAPAWLAELPATAEAVLRRGVVWRGGGWIFEPGVWRDYPDMRYAAVPRVRPGDPPAPLQQVSPDVSHFSRWPLWLRSYSKGVESAASQAYLDSLQHGLRYQFFTRVVDWPHGQVRIVRTRNYMDGRNGVYRWDYESRRGTGYGPYELSGTLFYGWWAFLGGEQAVRLHRLLYQGFPYSPAELRTYLGPWSNPIRYEDGRYRLIVRLAAAIAASIDTTGVVRPISLPLTDSLTAVFARGLVPDLRRDLWQGADAQSAPYLQMVPMHAAFYFGWQSWLKEYDDHFRRFSQTSPRRYQTRLLDRLHYLYFASRYLALSGERRRASPALDQLLERVETEIHAMWTGYAQPVSSTGWGEPAFKDFRRYLRWKLCQPKPYLAEAPRCASALPTP